MAVGMFDKAVDDLKYACDAVDVAYGEVRLENMKLRAYVDFLEDHIIDWEFATVDEAHAFLEKEHKRFLNEEREW